MTSQPKPRRSVLYMPGANARALEKAKSHAADVLILDLEDSVSPDQKEMAREQVRAAAKAGGYGAREMVIRINGLETPWGTEDLMAALAAGPDAILVPKVNSPVDIRAICGGLSASDNSSIGIWAMIETPRAILDIDAIAATAGEPDTPLEAFVLGTNDLAKETGAVLKNGRPGFQAWLSMTVLAARAHGLAVIDGVYNALQDADGYLAECGEGRDLGMDGKTLIHPNQIEVANRIFAPSDEEVEVAHEIIAAFMQPENVSKGAISLNGRMVERLHAEMASKTVSIARAIAQRAQGT